MKYLISLLLFSSNFSLAVVNGEKVDEKNHPQVGEISITFMNKSIDNGAGACTGSLISPKVILTAAHCFISKKVRKIGEGVVDLRGEIRSITFKGEELELKNVLIHSDYTLTAHPFEKVNRDLALIVSKKDLGNIYFPVLKEASQIQLDQPFFFYGHGYFAHYQPQIIGPLNVQVQKLEQELKVETDQNVLIEKSLLLKKRKDLRDLSESKSLRRGNNTISTLDAHFYLSRGISFREEDELQRASKTYLNFPYDGDRASIQSGDSGGPAVIVIDGTEYQFAVTSSSGKELVTLRDGKKAMFHSGESYFVPLQTKYFSELMLALKNI